MRTVFYRNIDARDLLDAFLVSSICSLLLVRFYLHLTGYPQIGNDTLHIAHVLYGGLFMMAAIVINLAFLGSRSKWVSAVLGGIGFGVFIDELGKFITKDNNYFFQPTIGLIYAIFVILYLTFNFLTRKQKLHSREYQMNVLSKLEEAVAYDLSRAEKADIRNMLRASNQNSGITKALRAMVSTLSITEDTRPSIVRKYVHKIDRLYERFWKRRESNNIVKILFVIEVLILTFASLATVFTNVDDVKGMFDGSLTYSQEVLIGQFASAFVAGCFVMYGLYLLGSSSRLHAFEQFRRSTLINIFLTQFFVFVRLEFQALPGLLLSVVLLFGIDFVMRQERRLRATDED